MLKLVSNEYEEATIIQTRSNLTEAYEKVASQWNNINVVSFYKISNLILKDQRMKHAQKTK